MRRALIKVALVLLAILVASVSALPAVAASGVGHASPTSAAGPFVIGGKPAGFGLWAIPYAQSSSPTGPQPLSDGDLVYSSTVSVYFLLTIPETLSINVSAVQYVPVTVTVLENETVNGNVTRVPVQVTEETQRQTVSALVSVSEGLTGATLTLPGASNYEDLHLTAGAASWDMQHLTPTADTLTSILTQGGIEEALAVEALLATLAIMVALYGARLLVRRIRRAPRTGPLWPAAWVAIPSLAWILFFVPTSQALGSLSPFVYPVVLAAAAFPYLCRLWSEHKDVALEGYQAQAMHRGKVMAAALPAVLDSGAWRPAPETWREAFWWLLGHPTDPLPSYSVGRDGVSARVDIVPETVACPLPQRWTLGVDALIWYRAGKPVSRLPTHLEWWTTSTVGKRNFRPHVVPGRLEAELIPPREPVEYSVGIMSVEEMARAHAEDHLLQAAYRAQVPRARREYAEKIADVILETTYGSGAPRGEDELRNLVARASQEERDREEEADGHPPVRATGEQENHEK